MENIHSAGNTFNPCLQILKEKGFNLSVSVTGNVNVFAAKNNDVSLSAFSPPELLGLAVLWLEYGNDWNRQEPNLFEQLPEDD